MSPRLSQDQDDTRDDATYSTAGNKKTNYYMNPVVVIFAPIIILGVPVYFISKYFERKMNPRQSFKTFMLWLLVVIGVAFAWYFICMFTFFKFFSLRS